MICVARNEISANIAREKRSFPWPSFLGGSSETPAAPIDAPTEDVSYDTADGVTQQELQQQQQQQSAQQQALLEQLRQQNVQHPQNLQHPSYAVPNSNSIQNPNVVYHYPIWRVHKYNGIDLKPMPVSMIPSHLQSSPAADNGAAQESESIGYVQQTELDPQTTGYEIAEGSERFERTTPDELRKLAIQLGFPDLSKLPSFEDAMSLLGATTPEETISIIKELAATESGRDLIKQFFQGNNEAENDGGETAGGEEQKPQQLTEEQQQLTEQQQAINDYQQQLLQLQRPQEFHFAQQDVQKIQQQQLHEQLIQQNQIQQQQQAQQNQIQQQQQTQQNQIQQQQQPQQNQIQPQQTDNQFAQQYQEQQQQQQEHQQQYQRQPDEHHQHLDPSDVAPHTHSGQNLPETYGPPQIRRPSQLLQPPTLLSTVGAGLDRVNTDLGLLRTILTTPRPQSGGFFQRITHFFKPPVADVDLKQFQQSVPATAPAQSFSHTSFSSYQNPHNPNIRTQDHSQFQPQFQSNHPQNPSANPSEISTIPIPQVPGLSEPNVDGFAGLLPTLPQLPQVHIPQHFHMPAEQQPAQTYVRVRYPLMSFNPVPDMHSIAQPLDEANSAAVRNEIGSIETIVLEEPRPDISQLPLDNFTVFKNAPQIINSYGAPALPYTFDDDDDTDTAGSENIAIALKAPIDEGIAESERETDATDYNTSYRVEENENENEFRPSEEQSAVAFERRISNGPQRISSYDSYATGKINRADADAVSAAIPTQSPTADVMMRSLPVSGELHL